VYVKLFGGRSRGKEEMGNFCGWEGGSADVGGLSLTKLGS